MNLVFKTIQEHEEFIIDRPFFYSIIKSTEYKKTPNILSLFKGYIVNPK